VARTCSRFGIAEKRLTPDAIRVLQAYRWPGNVRELENVIERTVALEAAEIISSGSLPQNLLGSPDRPIVEQISLPEEGIDLEEYLENLRLSLMRQALDRTGGQQKRAAEMLRLTYRAFRYHADKLGLTHDEEAVP
jgi:two-component system response regulator PilR (NtrC family)